MLATRARMIQPAAAGIPSNGLLHHWKCDEGSGSTVTDYGPVGVDGNTETDEGTTITTAWAYDSGLGRDVFDGRGGIDMINVSGVVRNPPYTIVLHTKRDNTTIDTTGEYLFDFFGGRITMLMYGPTSVNTYDGNFYDALTAGTYGVYDAWEQYAFILEPSAPDFAYFNGTVGHSLSMVNKNLGGKASLYNRYNKSPGRTNGISGYCADALIYDRALSVVELNDIRTAVLG